jgi:LacI family transcriptional regulator
LCYQATHDLLFCSPRIKIQNFWKRILLTFLPKYPYNIVCTRLQWLFVKKMNLTIKDIAKIVGVSHATVSRVINRHENVHPKTREHILKILAEHNFVTHSSARSLVMGKNYILGLLVLYDLFEERVPTLFLPSILSGLTSQLENTDYNLMMFFIRHPEKAEFLNMRNLSPKRLDGLFIICRQVSPHLKGSLEKIALPTLVINQRIIDSDFNYVISDDATGGYLATCHLVEQGHRDIAFFGVDPSHGNAVDREVGFDRACREHKLRSVVKLPGQSDADSACQAMDECLKSGKTFTAIFAASDYMALGAMNSLQKAGLRVPNDVAVVGYNNLEFARLIKPSLTTVRRPRFEIGVEAVKVMMELINNKNAGRKNRTRITIRPELIIRESSVRKTCGKTEIQQKG